MPPVCVEPGNLKYYVRVNPVNNLKAQHIQYSRHNDWNALLMRLGVNICIQYQAVTELRFTTVRLEEIYVLSLNCRGFFPLQSNRAK